MPALSYTCSRRPERVDPSLVKRWTALLFSVSVVDRDHLAVNVRVASAFISVGGILNATFGSFPRALGYR